MSLLQAIRGTKDILPNEIKNWQVLENVCRNISQRYGYNEIRTPVFEKTEVFLRGVGEGTDIVNKEMYTFEDKGGESLTLRPEQTAALVRAVIQNNLLANINILRLFYIGSYYRYERPQKGRLREFHQYGVECLLSPYPESDVEVIMLADTFIKSIGIENYKLKINSLGNEASRKMYLDVLKKYLENNLDNMSEDSRRRVVTNPLRVLDSKHPDDIELLNNAPNILDYLDDESQLHFDKVKTYLDCADIKYEVIPSLVRGLDYYSHTVFEFQSNYLGSQDSFGGGGRYNKLFEELGGKPTPAVGFAMGMERLLLILDAIDKKQVKKCEPLVYVIPMSNEQYEYALKIAALLRNQVKINTVIDIQRRSFKAVLKDTDKLDADYALIIGEDEIKNNGVMLKNLKERKQQFVKIDELCNIF